MSTLKVTKPVAAWQFRLSDRNSYIRIVGIENGDSDAFQDSPYYDRDAVNGGDAERIIVADFSLAVANQLPIGRTRIATVHIMISGRRGTGLRPAAHYGHDARWRRA